LVPAEFQGGELNLRSILRTTLAVIVGLLFALPAVGDEEVGGGDSGIWILPRSSSMVTQLIVGGGANLAQQSPRAVRVITSPSACLTMKMPSEMGAPIASLWEVAPLGLTLPISVSGNHVTISQRTMLALLSPVSTGSADGLMVDTMGLGFRLLVRRTAPNTLRFEIY
jgi:hypothetical protein